MPREGSPRSDFNPSQNSKRSRRSAASPAHLRASRRLRPPPMARRTLVRLPAPLPAPEKSSHVSPVIWVLFGGVLVFAALASAQWAKNARAAEKIPAPSCLHLAAPKPPDFALTIPAPEAPAPRTKWRSPRRRKPPETKPAESKSESANAQPPSDAAQTGRALASSLAIEFPAKQKSARQQELERTRPWPLSAARRQSLRRNQVPAPADPQARYLVGWTLSAGRQSAASGEEDSAALGCQLRQSRAPASQASFGSSSPAPLRQNDCQT